MKRYVTILSVTINNLCRHITNSADTLARAGTRGGTKQF